MLGYQEHETGRIVDPEAEKYQAARIREEHGAARDSRLKKEEDEALRKRHEGDGKWSKGAGQK
jgi:hypothetical protein